MSDWEASAEAWITSMGDRGDRSREHVLDPPMRALAAGARRALDVGCGEGRFCRALRAEGIEAVGLDPTEALLREARRRDPSGTYVSGRAEALPFEAGSFDLVVSYLSLIDIAGYRAAITEMTRVMTPGGRLLVANLQPWTTATPRNWPEGKGGWITVGTERRYYAFDDYMEERSGWAAWRGIRVLNHHRPLSAYFSAFLGAGLELRAFEEPPCLGGDPDFADKYARVPWFHVMLWQKPDVMPVETGR
ncbi:MAG: class I SAM-dependent methyltransferase [Pseudomonadota bacterium]